MKGLKIARVFILAIYIIVILATLIVRFTGLEVVPNGSTLSFVSEMGNVMLSVPILGYAVTYLGSLPGRIILGVIGVALIASFFINFSKHNEDAEEEIEPELTEESVIEPKLTEESVDESNTEPVIEIIPDAVEEVESETETENATDSESDVVKNDVPVMTLNEEFIKPVDEPMNDIDSLIQDVSAKDDAEKRVAELEAQLSEQADLTARLMAEYEKKIDALSNETEKYKAEASRLEENNKMLASEIQSGNLSEIQEAKAIAERKVKAAEENARESEQKLKAAADNIRILEKKLKDADKKDNESNKKIKELTDRLDISNAELEHRSAELSEKTAALAERNAELAERSTEAAKYKDVADVMREKLDIALKEKADIESKLNETINAGKANAEKVTELEQMLQQTADINTENRGRISEAEQEIEKLKAEADADNQMYSTIYERYLSVVDCLVKMGRVTPDVYEREKLAFKK